MIVPFADIRDTVSELKSVELKGEIMMKLLKKFLFASFLGLALSVSGGFTTQCFGQDKKAPEPVKEREKHDKKDDQKDRKNDDKKNDDRRGGDRKRP